MSPSSRTPPNITFNMHDGEIGMLVFVNILFSIVGALGNIFVCFLFVNSPQVRQSMSLFIMSLALSDLLVSLVAQPMYAVSLLKGFKQHNQENTYEDIRKCLTWVSLLASAGNLLGVTVHRYASITRPLVYQRRGIKICLCYTVVVIWFVAILIGVSTAFSKSSRLIGQLFVFVLLICLIFPLYCRILCIANKQQKHIVANFPVNDENVKDSKTRRRDINYTPERTALKTIGIISIGFVFGWFPLLTFPFVYRGFPQHRQLLLHLFQWVNTFALCSSAFNPIVYSWTDRRFRKSLQLIYKRWAVKRLIFMEVTAV